MAKKVLKPRKSAGGSVTARADPQSIDGWRRECERLRAELAASRAEIAELRRRQEIVLNRIDWILDSLDSLPERND